MRSLKKFWSKLDLSSKLLIGGVALYLFIYLYIELIEEVAWWLS